MACQGALIGVSIYAALCTLVILLGLVFWVRLSKSSRGQGHLNINKIPFSKSTSRGRRIANNKLQVVTMPTTGSPGKPGTRLRLMSTPTNTIGTSSMTTWRPRCHRDEAGADEATPSRRSVNAASRSTASSNGFAPAASHPSTAPCHCTRPAGSSTCTRTTSQGYR